MASILMMAGGAIVNALAFTGGNALFSMIDKNGAREEAKRHNAAIEKLNKEQAEYNKKRAENQDWLQMRTARKRAATNELYSANASLDDYKKFYSLPHSNLQTPSLDYEPSSQQKKYEKIFTGAGTAAAVLGAIASK